MPSLPGWLGGAHAGAEQQREFERWPSAPVIKPVSAEALVTLPALTGEPQLRRETHPTYRPLLVIGLGAMGAEVLRQWLTFLEQDSTELRSAVHVMLLTTTLIPPLSSSVVQVYQLDLADAKAKTLTRRDDVHRKFREVALYRQFYNYLRTILIALKGDVRVLVVAHVAEPIIGILGELLQALRLLPHELQAGEPYRDVSVLLGLEELNAPSAFESGEVFAALREIGRFTFTGPHIMEAAPVGSIGRVVSSALLDHVLVVSRPPSSDKSSLTASQAHEALAEVLAETLYTLLHPAAELLWDKLNFQAGQTRSTSHEAVAHSPSVATLYAPVKEIQEYLATRLAHAVVFGERPDRPTEGLMPTEMIGMEESPAALIARRWLINSPLKHPVFEWLVSLVGPQSLQMLPVCADDYKALFQAQLAHGVVAFLNDATQPNRLASAQAAVGWLDQHLVQIEQWLKGGPASKSKMINHLAWQDFLSQGLNTLRHLGRQLDEWQIALALQPPQLHPRGRQPEVSGTWRQLPSTSKPSGWRREHTLPPSSLTPSAPQPVLSDLLRQQREKSENALSAATTGIVRRALTDGSVGCLGEAEAYYTGTLRPELSQFGLESSPIFRRLRERLGWWIQLTPGEPPRLYLICMPVNIGGRELAEQPPPEARFAPAQVWALGTALLSCARVLAQGFGGDLTGQWFRRRLETQVEFLRRATEPFLAVDEDRAATHQNTLAWWAYLLAANNILSGEFKTRIFRNLPPHEIQDMPGSEAAHLSAIGMRLNIPLSSITAVRQAQKRYQPQESLHFYRPEQTAVAYEGRPGWREILPADLVVALADPQLVTVFCQAAFCQLIDCRLDPSEQRLAWTVQALADFPALSLSAAEPRGLWNALRRFALELPHDRQQELNPHNHFASGRRKAFVEALWHQARQCRQQLEFSKQREMFEANELRRWRQWSDQDRLARGFVLVLEAELDEPVWTGWDK